MAFISPPILRHLQSCGTFLSLMAGLVLTSPNDGLAQSTPKLGINEVKPATTVINPNGGDKFFDRKELMPIGAYYYPEAWPARRWERDIKRMAELGFTFTHLGEFAWAAMEPTEGNYRFGWLDTTVALCAKYGVKVIMCTPSPCPPAWLSAKHPEIQIMNADGRTMRHGGRLQGSWSSPIYREYVKKIVTELGKRYGNNPNVIGWQLDNEPSHGGAHYDYAPAAQTAFRAWVKQKYGVIDSLNKHWGAAFWSNTYTSFDQIRIPNDKESTAGTNPHQVLDFQRFQSQEMGNYMRDQTMVLRKLINPKQWVTSNFAFYKFLPEVNLYDNKDHLDFSAFTFYWLSTYLDNAPGKLGYRLGSGLGTAFASDFARATHGYTGIMELQPGQINWGAFNPQPLPGAVRMWVWHHFGLGSKFACTYRFDRPTYGGELYHYGIMDPDGVTPSLGGKEYIQAGKEIASLKKLFNPKANLPADVAARKVAILWNQDNLWDLQNYPHTNQWDTWEHVYRYFSAAKRSGAPIDFVSEDIVLDPTKYPTAIAPAYQLVDAKLVARWRTYVEQGGHLILSCRSGQKDRSGQLWEGPYIDPLRNLIGANLDYYDQLPNNATSTLAFAGKDFNWNNWGEILSPHTKPTYGSPAQVWGQHTSQFYAGKAGVIHRKVGKGSVTYNGTDSDDGELELAVLQKVYAERNIKAENLKPYFFKEWRDGFWVAVNYTSEDQDANPGPNAKFHFGSRTVAPGQVAVWTE